MRAWPMDDLVNPQEWMDAVRIDMLDVFADPRRVLEFVKAELIETVLRFVMEDDSECVCHGEVIIVRRSPVTLGRTFPVLSTVNSARSTIALYERCS